ncbi:unnamed protein product [Microthlaspi erraticum]|uniref:F-box domain-containing protein n=1 Tax=Microthlaspi erraticum TaxID=1685480 RepID=A0A6D2IIJ2_9BRAS|nr:unnamed protein product [Microthlaspi erraticum]
MTNIINLPEDLVVEIFSRISAVSLAQLRSTSKGWNALIGDGRLAKKHSANAPKQSLVIVVTNLRVCLLSVDLRGMHDNVAPSAKVSAPFSLKGPKPHASEEVDIREVFHCDGLLLCTTTDDRLVVSNPCSGETRWIPIPSKHYDKEIHMYALGKSSCNKYKILRVDRLNRYEYEIYDLTSDSWTCVGVITDLYSSGGIAMKGNTYWCSRSPEGPLLVCFDYSTEKFTRMSLPEDPDDTLAHSALNLTVTREGQQLCLLSTSFSETTNQINVWITTKSESPGAMSWSKFVTLSRTRADLISRLQFMMGTRFLFDEENKVVLSCNGPTEHSKNIIHIMGDDKYIDVNHHGAEPTSPDCFLLSYVPSLVQIQQAI